MRSKVFFATTPIVLMALIHVILLIFFFSDLDLDHLSTFPSGLVVTTSTLTMTMTNNQDENDPGLPPPEAPQPKPKPRPRDGPAVVFEADPMVPDIFTGEDGDYFGLVLVTNWPVSPLAAVDGPYQRFLAAVRSCFRDEDVAVPSSSSPSPSSLPAVYLYPTVYLHVTLATFQRPVRIADTPGLSDAGVRSAKTREALEWVRSASELPGWPREPLRLVVDSAQIGTKAGILLWKDLSGGIDAMRNCLREALAERPPVNHNDNDNGGTTVGIPGIVHSTFLRFAEVPVTPGEDVQEAFRSRGLERPGEEFFRESGGDGDGNGDGDEQTAAAKPLILRANTVRLVSETVPYMHLPNDDEHVLWTTELAR